MSAELVTNPVDLKKVLLRPDVWRGESYRFAKKQSISTGFEQLDTALLNNGWPLNQLIEVLQNTPGQGEWQLLSKAVQAPNMRAGYIILIDPPEHLYLPGLSAMQVHQERILVVNPKSVSDAIYCFTTAAASHACIALVAWESTSFAYKDLRKLQLSAVYGSGLCFLFRHSKKRAHNSPASLRLEINMLAEGIELAIHKQRGSFKQQRVVLDTPKDWQGKPSLSSNDWLQDAVDPSTQILPISS